MWNNFQITPVQTTKIQQQNLHKPGIYTIAYRNHHKHHPEELPCTLTAKIFDNEDDPNDFGATVNMIKEPGKFPKPSAGALIFLIFSYRHIVKLCGLINKVSADMLLNYIVDWKIILLNHTI